MSEKIVIYTQYRLDRHTGESTKSHPVELTEEQFSKWIEPAIPYLYEVVVGLIKKEKGENN